MISLVKNFDDKDANKFSTIIIAVHGFSSSKDSFINKKLAPILKENNIGLVCFDLPGHGDRKNELLTVDSCLKSIKVCFRTILATICCINSAYKIKLRI